MSSRLEEAMNRPLFRTLYEAVKQSSRIPTDQKAKFTELVEEKCRTDSSCFNTRSTKLPQILRTKYEEFDTYSSYRDFCNFGGTVNRAGLSLTEAVDEIYDCVGKKWFSCNDEEPVNAESLTAKTARYELDLQDLITQCMNAYAAGCMCDSEQYYEALKCAYEKLSACISNEDELLPGNTVNHDGTTGVVMGCTDGLCDVNTGENILKDVPVTRLTKVTESVDSDASYCIRGITYDGSSCLYDAKSGEWTDDKTQATTWKDVESATDVWSNLSRAGFKRISIVPVFEEA